MTDRREVAKKTNPVKVRLVRAVIQFDLLVDDGENLTPIGNYVKDQNGEPGVVSAVVDASEWSGYATGRFVESMTALEGAVELALANPPTPEPSEAEGENGS